ncbi:MAG TPA: HIT family protein [Sphaerochaeta sp.]|nr:HIT family protein [Sphaerochaeta sp.]
METIFTKIRDGQLPSARLYEDEHCFVILDINPVNQGHALVISNAVYPTLADTPAEIFAHMMGVVQQVDAKLHAALGCDATNIVINNGKASGQEIPHLHIHVIPRYLDDTKEFRLSTGVYTPRELADLQEQLRLQ